MPLKPMESGELAAKIRHVLKYASVYVSDRTYAAVKKSFMTDSLFNSRDFYDFFAKVLSAIKVPGWEPDFDCDNFAMLYVVIAAAVHRHSKKVHDEKPEGPAVGFMWYKQDNGGGHAINVCVGDNYEVYFVEPQTGEEKCLSRSERNSCWLAVF